MTGKGGMSQEVELGSNPTNYLVQTQVFLRRKENPQKGNLV